MGRDEEIRKAGWASFKMILERERELGVDDAAFLTPDCGRDPETTVTQHPFLTRAKRFMNRAYPHVFGGAYEDSDGVIHIGITDQAPSDVRESVLKAVPEATVEVRAVKHSWPRLIAVANEVAERLGTGGSGPVVSVTPNEEKNTVLVGVTDLDSQVARAIAAYYGDAVELFPDAPARLLASSPPLKH
jgi:hypothetical protein